MEDLVAKLEAAGMLLFSYFFVINFFREITTASALGCNALLFILFSILLKLNNY